jgi:hypothetical protein
VNAAQRRAERKSEIVAAGYSIPVATALARIEHERHRRAIARGLAGTGIADGPPRAYLVALTASELKVGDYPSCPKSVRPQDAGVIQERAAALAETILPKDLR